MLRRTVRTPSQPDHWMLFPQIHHAVFAGLIAEGWRSPMFAPIEPNAELMTAINGHDDGWGEWDESPQVDPNHGWPIAFNEMRTADALTIWSRSIDRAQLQGPLVAYAVAGHFLRLLSEFDSWKGKPAARPLAENWLENYHRRMTEWLDAWTAEDPRHNAENIAHRSVEFVRLFDALSLWFLCAERTEPATFSTPDGPEVTFTPTTPFQITVDPWPYKASSNRLSATGRLIPARRYSSADDLSDVPWVERELVWMLRPTQ